MWKQKTIFDVFQLLGSYDERIFLTNIHEVFVCKF